MNRPLHPAVFQTLRRIQQSPHVGLHGFFRRNHDSPRSPRTVYRWQRSLGDHLLVVPNVTVEALGLRHAHVFIAGPESNWLSCPYGIEGAWVSPDLVAEVLYLHCLVPDGPSFLSWCNEQRCTAYEIVWSGSGWQQFLFDHEPIEVPVTSDAAPSGVLRHHPFVLPAIVELWQFPNSLPLAWARIHQRLGRRIKEFLPRTRVHYVNGKTHLTDAFHHLSSAGLLRQQVVRYHPLLATSVEVFVRARFDRTDLSVLLDGVRSCLHAIETYPTIDGYWCRLLGPHQLLDAIIRLPADMRARLSQVYFHTKRYPTPMVRFAYETLYNERDATWTVTA